MKPMPPPPKQRPTTTQSTLPIDLESERWVIGSVLRNEDILDEVSLVISPADFGDADHGELLRVMLNLRDSGKRFSANVKGLVDGLKREGVYEKLGGSNYLNRVMDEVPTYAHWRYHAEKVRSASVRRRLILASHECIKDCSDLQLETHEPLDRMESRLVDISDRSTEATEPLDAQQFARMGMDALELRKENPEALGVRSGFYDLDAKLGGLRAGQLAILAARPSMGKTAFAANIAEYVAVTAKTQTTTLIVSLEMSAVELCDRLLASMARVPAYKLRDGTLEGSPLSNVVAAAAELSRSKMHVIDAPSLTTRQIAAHARRIKRKRDLGLLIIDYLQLVEPTERGIPREQQVAATTRQLKAIAKELQIPIICLAQLNRKAEDSDRPKLSHLRESGAIEQDADVVMFIHREEYFRPNVENKGKAEIIIAKQRCGPVGTINLVWREEITRFENSVKDDFLAAKPLPKANALLAATNGDNEEGAMF